MTVRLDAVPLPGVDGAEGVEGPGGDAVVTGGWHVPAAQCQTATTGAGMLTW